MPVVLVHVGVRRSKGYSFYLIVRRRTGMLDITRFSLLLPAVGLLQVFMQNNGSTSAGRTQAFIFLIGFTSSREYSILQRLHNFKHIPQISKVKLLIKNMINLVKLNWLNKIGLVLKDSPFV